MLRLSRMLETGRPSTRHGEVSRELAKPNSLTGSREHLARCGSLFQMVTQAWLSPDPTGKAEVYTGDLHRLILYRMSHLNLDIVTLFPKSDTA